MKLLGFPLVFLLLIKNVSAHRLRRVVRTESSSSDSNNVADAPHEENLSNDEAWVKYLRENLSNEQYEIITQRNLQEDLLLVRPNATTGTIPVAWLGQFGFSNNSTNEDLTVLSDIPSMVPSDSSTFLPSDIPSGAPSDVPSTAPTTATIPEVLISFFSGFNTPSNNNNNNNAQTLLVPSDIPSDVPSMVPSDVPSLAPSVAFVRADPGEARSNILNLIEQDGRLNWFRVMIEKGQMEESLQTDQNITVFAPTNGAFQVMDRSYFAKFLRVEYALHVREVVRHHVLRGVNDMADLQPGISLDTTHQLGTLDLVMNGITGKVEIASMAASNANIVDWDVVATNGIVHYIDQVLLPDFVKMDAMTFLEQSEFNQELQLQNIDHGSILAIVVAAGFEDRLRTLDDATIFLPTDDAISPELFAFLMDDANEQLRQEFLEFHMLPVVLNFENLLFRTPVFFDTVQGERLSVVRRVGLVVNGALTISFSLIRCGIIYHTDKALIPSSFPSEFQSIVTMDPDELPEFTSPLELAEHVADLGLDADTAEVFMLFADAAAMWKVSTSTGLTMFLPSIDNIIGLNGRFKTRFLQQGYELHSYTLAAFHMSTETLPRALLVDQRTIDMVAGGSIKVFVDEDEVHVRSSVFPDAFIERSIDASGVGIIHVIEGALLPQWGSRSVVAHLKAVDNQVETYTKFRKLIAAAGMESLLDSSNDITLLAPRDEAIPDEMLNFLTTNRNSGLAMQVVGFHVLKRVINHISIKANHSGLVSVGTFQGSHQDIVIQFDSMFIGQAMASTYGLATSSVVYGIDTLLLPSFVVDEIPSSIVLGPIMASGPVPLDEFPVEFPEFGLSSTMMESF